MGRDACEAREAAWLGGKAGFPQMGILPEVIDGRNALRKPRGAMWWGKNEVSHDHNTPGTRIGWGYQFINQEDFYWWFVTRNLKTHFCLVIRSILQPTYVCLLIFFYHMIPVITPSFINNFVILWPLVLFLVLLLSCFHQHLHSSTNIPQSPLCPHYIQVPYLYVGADWEQSETGTVGDSISGCL